MASKVDQSIANLLALDKRYRPGGKYHLETPQAEVAKRASEAKVFTRLEITKYEPGSRKYDTVSRALFNSSYCLRADKFVILIFSSSEKEHKSHVTEFRSTLAYWGLELDMDECAFDCDTSVEAGVYLNPLIPYQRVIDYRATAHFKARKMVDRGTQTSSPEASEPEETFPYPAEFTFPPDELD